MGYRYNAEICLSLMYQPVMGFAVVFRDIPSQAWAGHLPPLRRTGLLSQSLAGTAWSGTGV
jgi:hypothetical protein